MKTEEETKDVQPTDAVDAAPKKKKRKFGTGIKNFFSDFKKLISRGNIVDLAVAVVVGSAFTAIVNSFVADIIMPLIGLATGKTDMSELVWVLKDDIAIHWGTFLQAILHFLLIAFFIFLVLRILMNAQSGLKKLSRKERKAAREAAAKAAAAKEEPAPAPVETELDLLRDIRALLQANANAEVAEKVSEISETKEETSEN